MDSGAKETTGAADPAISPVGSTRRPIHEGKAHAAKSAMLTDDPMRNLAERVLANLRAIKTDPAQKLESLKLLKAAAEAFALHRQMLEALRDRSGPEVRAELDEQLSLFLLLEHECRSQLSDERPV